MTQSSTTSPSRPVVAPADQPTAQSAKMGIFLPAVPSAFFGMVLGLAGLGNAWRAATDALHLPSATAKSLMSLAIVVWAVLVAVRAEMAFPARGSARGSAAPH